MNIIIADNILKHYLFEQLFISPSNRDDTGTLSGKFSELAQTILKSCEHTFDNVLKSAKFIKIDNGNCMVEIKPAVEHGNVMNVVHGGFLTTAIETFTTYALGSHKDCGFIQSYSIDTHVSYLKSIQVGQELIVDCKITKIGKHVAFTECLISDKHTGEALVKGNHTKFLNRDKKLVF
ncbi:hypothetical protein FQR65_LT13972 [Abscondita terminalis]|nr:hypothetical protein FQR65_LT13972 [Abscondita terminalis]